MNLSIEKIASKTDLASFKNDLSKEIEKPKVYTIKWMFIFWVGHILAMLAMTHFVK